jgi:hypothetical protein
MSIRPKRDGVFAAQADFFSPPAALSGLSQAEGFVSAAEALDLIAAINASDLQPFRFQGWTASA